MRGHVARANPNWAEIARDVEVLAIFHGPDAYGTVRVVDDRDWLRAHLEAFTAENERAFAKPWHLEEAPPDFVEKLIAATVGIEIVVTRLVGKWKASQNQPAENRAGVIDGLRASGNAAAAEMAALVAYGKPVR